MSDALEALIPILGGIYATLLGYRVIGNGVRYEAQLRILGPLVTLLGIAMFLVARARYLQ